MEQDSERYSISVTDDLAENMRSKTTGINIRVDQLECELIRLHNELKEMKKKFYVTFTLIVLFALFIIVRFC